jgi:hypothetical protein
VSAQNVKLGRRENASPFGFSLLDFEWRLRRCGWPARPVKASDHRKATSAGEKHTTVEHLLPGTRDQSKLWRFAESSRSDKLSRAKRVMGYSARSFVDYDADNCFEQSNRETDAGAGALH